MKIAKSIAVIAALTVGLAVTPTTAQAVDPEPTTSPGPAARIRVQELSASQCSSGYLCAYVESNSDHLHGWWLFKYTRCGIVNLNNWHDQLSGYDSFVIDDQTGGVTTTLYSGYNGTGTVLQRITPRAGQRQDVLYGGGRGWNPVNSIRVC
ncbi:hypothetical protein OG474_08685 [Kribbella sp. NBC_01505]|uniref:hypothetical protein n=1 Tax=Kribbella sp. NBC_01505 TaxID=2903580 RepID=UPI00386E389E